MSFHVYETQYEKGEVSGMTETNEKRMNVIGRNWREDEDIEAEDIDLLVEQAERALALELSVEGYQNNWYKCIDGKKTVESENKRLREALLTINALHHGSDAVKTIVNEALGLPT